MVGHDLLLVLTDDAVLTARTTHHTVDGLFEQFGGDGGAVLAGGQQCGLVDDVRQIGTRHTRGALGQTVEVRVGVDRLALCVDVEDRLAARHVGVADGDLAVETARTQKSRVEDVGPVGGRDQDDAGTLTESVHLDEQLVEGLLALVVSAAQAGAALTSDGVDLIDEDDAGAVVLGLLEHVAHT